MKESSSGQGTSLQQVASNLRTIQPALFVRDLNQSKTGTRGAISDSLANYVRIVTHPLNQMLQYHVKFEPIVDSKACREEMLKVIGIFDFVIFDGAMLYAPKAYKFQPSYVTPHPNTEENIKVSFKVTMEFGHDNPQALHVYDLLIRRCMKATGLISVARHFFDPRRNVSVDQYGIECWPGYFTATRLHDDGLMVCIENRWKVLRKDTVASQMVQILRRTGGVNERFWSECERLFANQTIITPYNHRMYRLTRVEPEMHPSSTFTLGSGEELTFAEYFQRQYNLQDIDMEQPLLVSEGKPKQPGEPPQKTYLLPQFCRLTGITDDMRNNMSIMRAMSQVTRLTPEARLKMTQGWLEQVRENPELQRLFQAWEFELDGEIIHFPARVLPEERLYGARPDGYVGQNAEWARFVKQNGNCVSKNLKDWILVAPNVGPHAFEAANKFIAECRNLGTQLGMRINEPTCVSVNSPDPTDYNQVVKEGVRRAAEEGRKVEMVVIILVDDNKTRYDSMKKLVCHDVPDTYWSLYGRNQPAIRLDLPEDPSPDELQDGWCCMEDQNSGIKQALIMGYDLYADSTTRGKAAGACVSSFDQDFTSWYSQCRHHDNPTELGTNLVHFVRKALRIYYERNAEQLPEKLFLYRDGVGDGQIPYVVRQELPLVQKACEEVAATVDAPPIKIAFILVTKKTNTRVFKQLGANVANPLPGTIVDSYITRPERYDFYMVPQAVNQGTVAPVHYSVLHDTTGFDADKHHALAFKLCHLYYNWQGTVRVPAPCQYAHKLAFLFAQSLHKEAHNSLRDKLFYL
ncbi:unnamed protein product, partial [Mesorhabditis belari]|uniref:Piwi domain protein n=1 Tax=Mesorhabditis belari TaxID=2138241 RepID=A0AAF3EUV6_9BILA